MAKDNLSVNISGNNIMVPGESAVRDALEEYRVLVRDDQVLQVQRYLALLLFWNQRVSLTSVTDPLEILGRHFGECMFASSQCPVENCRLADVGSGAGFPGLALKILQGGIKLHLIEQNTKKATFLKEVARFLNLGDVFVHRTSYSALSLEIGPFDWITSRALGDYKDLLDWSRNRLSDTGSVSLWVGSEEGLRLDSHPGWRWDPPIPIPNSRRRVILAGTPLR